MGPEVAEKANPGKEPPPTSRTVVGRGCAVVCGCSGLSHLAFLLGFLDTLLLFSLRSGCDDRAPGGAIRSKCLPGFHINGEVPEMLFQIVSEALLLPSNLAFTLGEFSIEKLFWYAVVRHAGDMACPSQLGLVHGGDGTWDVCTLQDLRVGDFVLPADVKKVTETSEMEVIDLPRMPFVQGPCFTAIE